MTEVLWQSKLKMMMVPVMVKSKPEIVRVVASLF